MMQTTESLKFIADLLAKTSPKWVTLENLSTHLREHKTNVQLWCILDHRAKAMTMDLKVLSYKEIIKQSQLIDLILTCVATPVNDALGPDSLPFTIPASSMMPIVQDPRAVTYMNFGSFARCFLDVEARDRFFEELFGLHELIEEMAINMHNYQVRQFFKYFKKKKS